jgi:hypothetical protein
MTGAGAGTQFTTDGVSNWGTAVQTPSTGGTGRQTLTNHSVLIGAGVNPITQSAVGANGQLFLGQTGADPAWGTMSQDCTITAAGVITCTKTNNVAFGPAATALAGQIPGTATNDSATAGNIGEFKTASAAASAVSLTAVTAANCVTLSLTAGDWAVSGNALFTGGATTTVSYARASASSVSATEGSVTDTFYAAGIAYFGSVSGSGFSVAAPAVRVSLASTANVFMEGFMNFSVSTATCGGTINAWRVR